MSTRHRNAGGPFTIFDPGLGITGSLNVEGNTHFTGSLRILEDGYTTTEDWAGATIGPLILASVNSGGTFGGTTMFRERYSANGDPYMALNITSGSIRTQDPATSNEVVTTNLIAGIRGDDKSKAHDISFITSNFHSTETQRVRISERPALQITGSLQNKGNASITGSLTVDHDGSGGENGVSLIVTGKKAGRFIQDIAAGYGLYVYRNQSEAGSFPLVHFKDDNTNNTQTTLTVTQDGTGDILNLFDGSTEVMTVLDGGNVGIGTSAPGAQLEVRGPTGSGTASAGVLRLSTAETSIVDNDQLGRIEFIAPVESDGTDAILVAAQIHAEATGNFTTTRNQSALVFSTGYSAVPTEKLRIDEDGISVFTDGSTNITIDPTNGEITADNFIGTISTAGTVTTAAQTNITSVGTLTGLTVSGDIVLSGDSAQISKTGMNSNTVFLQCTAPDNDVEVLRVSHNSTTLNAFNFGYSLVYSGSGSGDDNTFQLMADNSSSGPRTPVWTAYNDGGFQIGSSGAKVTTIENNDSLGTSDTKLCTQGNVKAYVDANAGGSPGGSNTQIQFNNSGAFAGDADLFWDGAYLSIGTGFDAGEPGIEGGSGYEDVNGRIQIRQKDDSFDDRAIVMVDSARAHGWSFQVNNTNGSLHLRSDHKAVDLGGAGDRDNGVIFLATPNQNSTVQTSAVSFTGYHRNIPVDDSLETYMDKHIGKIVVSTGEYQNLYNDRLINKPMVGQALSKIQLSSKRKQKSCFGVVSGIETSEHRYYGYGGMMSSVVALPEDDRRVLVNSLGEGGLWICNINGNLENGDYITTCEVPGLGMKQDTEMLCNYTVAKITQDCNFRKNAANYDVEEFEFEGKTYRKAFVGCTYHCG